MIPVSGVVSFRRTIAGEGQWILDRMAVHGYNVIKSGAGAPTNDDVDPFSDLGQTIEAHYRGVLPE